MRWIESRSNGYVPIPERKRLTATMRRLLVVAPLILGVPGTAIAQQQHRVTSIPQASSREFHRENALDPESDPVDDDGYLVDTWRIDLLPLQTITVRVESDSFDTRLKARTEGGLVSENDDHGGSTNSLLEIVADDDGGDDRRVTVWLMVSSFAPGESGPYVIRGVPGPTGRPMLNAGDRTFPERTVKGIPYDSILLEVEESGRLRVDTDPSSLATSVRDAAGRVVAQSFGSEAGQFDISVGSTVLYVFGHERGPARYGIRATAFPRAAAENVLEIDDSLTTEYLQLPTAEYYWQTDLTEMPSTGTLVVTLESAVFDPYLVVKGTGPDGPWTRRDDDGGGGLNSRLEIPSNLRIEGGALRVIVTSAFPGETGGWRLRVTTSKPEADDAI